MPAPQAQLNPLQVIFQSLPAISISSPQSFFVIECAARSYERYVKSDRSSSCCLDASSAQFILSTASPSTKQSLYHRQLCSSSTGECIRSPKYIDDSSDKSFLPSESDGPFPYVLPILCTAWCQSCLDLDFWPNALFHRL